MGLGDGRESGEPVWFEIERGTAIGVESIGAKGWEVEMLDFIERFNVVGGEGEGNDDDVRAGPGGVIAKFIGVGTEPFTAAELRLVGELSGGEGKSGADKVIGGFAFRFVRVAFAGERLRKAMSGEEECRLGFGKVVSGEEVADVVLEGRDVGWVGCVGVDPTEFEECAAREVCGEEAGDAACRGVGELGKERENSDDGGGTGFEASE